MSLAPAQVTLHKLARRDHEVEASPLNGLTTPFVYSLLIPLVLADADRAPGAASTSRRRTG